MGRGPSPVLKGVKCIVDVRMSAGDADVDCSAAVSEKLESLGAKVMKRLGRDTTHVVWLNGNRNVREDTLKRNEVKLVGPLWVEACLQTATRVPETKFFPVETTANKSTPLPTPAAEKKKRRRSSLMEPRREDVFDELTTPIKKSRRKTLEQVTPLAITLTPQEGSGGGKSRIVDDFAAPVTHVVVSDTSKRTMKILFGLAQGAHIVSDAWVYSSLEAKKWLDETPFLMAQYPVPKVIPSTL
ncbi:hypothetical protein DYB32_003645 [Aphanomyces invadans]|uniref:BRCT domain-containing protein n=1 Tax=Aphanomyces invadans TaxID=157072 RepID=A0A418AZX8_9STRA|nr:hypothetical protein DYB32_003645 [Aphanomyces invadans]